MEIEVREAETGDVDSICSVNRKSIEELTGQSYTTEQVSAWASAVTPELYPIDSAETYFLVAERDERIVGFGWLKTDADEYFRASVDGEITGLYVSPDVAGCGVGTRLYDELEAFAIEQSIDSLGLWASLNAVPFYEKRGYTEVTEQVVDYGVCVSVLEMRKQLD